MSQLKQDYLKLLPDELKSKLFSFFSPRELDILRPTDKDLNRACDKFVEEKLVAEYEKILEKKLCIEEMDPDRPSENCFYAIDTFNKFKAFIALDPSYLNACYENNMVLIQQVGIMLGISGAEYSLHLMCKDKTKMKAIYESDTSHNKCVYEEWFNQFIINIRCNALVHGQLVLFNRFFPDTFASEMLHLIVNDMIIPAYNSHPIIDSGVDEESLEGKVQKECFEKAQQFVLELFSKYHDEYKVIITTLIDKGFKLDDGEQTNLSNWQPGNLLKRWRKEHDYFLPEKILVLLDIISEASGTKSCASKLGMG